MSKLQVVKIETGFSEAGPEVENRTFSSFAEFNGMVNSPHLQPGQGYYKTDFVVTFEDGVQYKGRFDIGCDSETLQAHMEYCIGRMGCADEFHSKYKLSFKGADSVAC